MKTLGSSKVYEAIVIGGGIAGSANAYYLMKTGVKSVAMIERWSLCDGSTGKSAGGFRQRFPTEQESCLAKASCEIIAGLTEELGEEIDFKQGGYLTLVYTPEEELSAKKAIVMHNNLGIDVVWMERDDVKTFAPWLNEKEGFIGATFCKSDGIVNPTKMSFAYARAARDLGCDIYSHTNVTKITINKDKTFTVHTPNEKFNAQMLFCCTGAYSEDIGRMIDYEIPILPQTREKLITEQVDYFQPFLCISSLHGLHFNQASNGSFYMSCSKNLVGRRTLGNTSVFEHETVSAISHLVPQLAKLNIICHWSGYYEITPDGKPFLGGIPGVEKFFIASGFNGHGIMLAPAATKELVSFALGKETAPWFSSFDIARMK